MKFNNFTFTYSESEIPHLSAVPTVISEWMWLCLAETLTQCFFSHASSHSWRLTVTDGRYSMRLFIYWVHRKMFHSRLVFIPSCPQHNNLKDHHTDILIDRATLNNAINACAAWFWKGIGIPFKFSAVHLHACCKCGIMVLICSHQYHDKGHIQIWLQTINAKKTDSTLYILSDG